MEGRVIRGDAVTPKEEIEARLGKLKALMERASLDGALFPL